MMETVCIGQGWCSFHDWVGEREGGDDGMAGVVAFMIGFMIGGGKGDRRGLV